MKLIKVKVNDVSQEKIKFDIRLKKFNGMSNAKVAEYALKKYKWDLKKTMKVIKEVGL